MIEGHIIFNAILYSIVIAYILYINFSAYYQTGTGFLKALVNLFQNWIFRTVYLLIVGFFSLDLFPYGGFVLAILLTIAFLNTNMLVYKKDVEESMANKDEKKASLPSDGTISQPVVAPPPPQTGASTPTYPSPQTGASTPTYPSPQTGAPTSTPTYPSPQTGASTPTYPSPQTGASTPTYPSPQTGASTPTYPSPQTGAPTSTPQYNFQ